MMHGTAHHTKGGLTKAALKYNRKTGRIVSRKVSVRSKRLYAKFRPIMKAHQFTKKSHGRKSHRKSHRKSR